MSERQRASGFSFDFNNDRTTHPELGPSVSGQIDQALSLEDGSRARAIEAVTAAKVFLADGGGGQPTPELRNALAGIARELERVEIALRDLEDGSKPGALVAPRAGSRRPPMPRAELAVLARAVVGVKWLHRLKLGNKLSKIDAERAIARLIPETFCNTRNGTRLTELEQLAAWQDAASRSGTRAHGAVLDASWQLEEQWEIGESHLEDATSAQVLEWVRAVLVTR